MKSYVQKVSFETDILNLEYWNLLTALYKYNYKT